MAVQARGEATIEPGTDVPVIERVRWRDLPALARVQRASFRPGLAYGLTALAFLRAMPGVVFLVARLPGLPVAGCVIGDQYKGDLRVVNIAVAPAARRRGVATALLRAIEAAQPAGNVVLIAEVHNTGAQALYEREGYVRSGHARDYYGRGRHGIWMRKDRTGEPPRTIRV
jgi:ribosomal protein S18 acetylase RimI-like enzyme